MAVVAASLIIYASVYYRAEPAAALALKSSDYAIVERTDYGWFFDGYSETDLLVFYPGAKIEESAYAPLLRLLAQSGVDVCLVKMPLKLAVFAQNKAETVFALYPHENKYIGGHSLGGAVAANYAASHGEDISGLILLAAYPTKTIAENVKVISVYGSKDEVINKDKLSKGRELAAHYCEFIIEGGNHAQFGNYGAQSGDGVADITAEKQQATTVNRILQAIGVTN